MTPTSPQRAARPSRKAPPLEIFPRLPTPSGDEVKEVRQAMGWTQGQVADLVGLSDAQAINEIERGDRKMTNARWTVMLLAARRHPTLKLVPAGQEQPSEQPLPE